MLAIFLALYAFNSPVGTVQLGQRRATGLCMKAVDILKRIDESENNSWKNYSFLVGFQLLPAWQCAQWHRRPATAWAPGASRSAAEPNFEASRWNSAPNMLSGKTDIWQSPVTRANYQCSPRSKIWSLQSTYLELRRLMVTCGVESDIFGSVVRDPRFGWYAGSGQT